MKINHRYLLIIGVVLISAAIYLWSFYQLGRQPEITLVAFLALPLVVYFWYFRHALPSEDLIDRQPAIVMLAYTLLYLAATYFINILASSVTLWLVQFLLPLLILKALKVPLSSISFRWKEVFARPVPLLLAALILIVSLIFVVRDSVEIIAMFGTWKAAVYLPLSVFYMVLIVAFWEEFFFRGVVMHSTLRLTGSPVVGVFLSALLFGIYHVPMRFMNSRSEYYGDLPSSFAATINEQFILGLFLGLIVYKCRNVWHAVWLHAVINGLSYMYKMSQMVKF